ncbi:Kinesin-like protein FLA10 [Apostasia shenzhenica]|uniref:Kinesin-like protein n=1 Tax=Apostasia shenzhenica TaxID=1088818 RepID=A0A2I0B9V9_9ASPA|nr:Kinesin-like protein FLA10 [Apostasia shenzhenica]
MPVITRSQISGGSSEGSYIFPARRQSLLRDPHHGLKEKMKALTLLYDQQNKKSQVLIHHPSADLLHSNRKNPTDDRKQEQELRRNGEAAVMRENIVIPKKKTAVFSKSEAKENEELKNCNRIPAYAMQEKAATVSRAAARRSSLAPVSEVKVSMGTKKTDEEAEVCGDLGSRIMVFVRLRPMGKKEEEAGARSCVRIVNKRDIYLTEFASEMDYLRLKRVRGRHFCFDASFPESTTQQVVYSTTTAELVEGVLQGRNGSVFCYGATGAGKTYTMLGTLENPGVMVLAIKDLFAKIRQRSFEGKHSVLLSYLEVYNETVVDLLSPGRPLVLREDKQGITAAGLTQYRAYSTNEVMQLLQQGNQNRTTEPTRVNETSSRSHAILQVIAEYQVKDSNMTATRVGKLSLIDLAGSERALATDQRSQRSIEGANINRSLLALSSCINALVEGKKHIPYRNSKLTQLLKDSLGGPCHTVMIANISPSNLSFNETQNTLHWADRAKEIRTKACTANEAVPLPESETNQTKLLLELQKENSELRQQTARLQQKLFSVEAQAIASSSPQPPPPILSNTPCSINRKPKRSILSGNCFSSPAVAANETFVAELQKRVKALEAEIEKLKKEHELQIKQKDCFIRQLIAKKGVNSPCGGEGKSRLGKRGGRPLKEDLPSHAHRLVSPQATAAKKKRSFWDISAANSPSVATANGRKTRSHVDVLAPQSPPAPSLLVPLAYHCFWFMFMWGPHIADYLLQPGFAWAKQNAAAAAAVN